MTGGWPECIVGKTSQSWGRDHVRKMKLENIEKSKSCQARSVESWAFVVQGTQHFAISRPRIFLFQNQNPPQNLGFFGSHCARVSRFSGRPVPGMVADFIVFFPVFPSDSPSRNQYGIVFHACFSPIFKSGDTSFGSRDFHTFSKSKDLQKQNHNPIWSEGTRKIFSRGECFF